MNIKSNNFNSQHEFATIAQKFQNDLVLEDVKQKNRIELEKEKYKINNPFQSVLDNLFGGGANFNKTGTEETLIDPDTGKPVDPKTADYVKIINSKNETLRVDVTEKQVDLALRALEQVQPNKNNTYTVNETIKRGDTVQLFKNPTVYWSHNCPKFKINFLPLHLHFFSCRYCFGDHSP